MHDSVRYQNSKTIKFRKNKPNFSNIYILVIISIKNDILQFQIPTKCRFMPNFKKRNFALLLNKNMYKTQIHNKLFQFLDKILLYFYHSKKAL